MDVATAFLVVGAVVTAVGAFLRYDGYDSHDAAGLLGQAIGGLELLVVGVIDQQRSAEAGRDCAVFGRCEGMPHTFWELVSPFLLGAVKGILIAAVAVGAGWVLARLTAREPAG